jgi:hypothetical protein
MFRFGGSFRNALFPVPFLTENAAGQSRQQEQETKCSAVIHEW